MKKPANHRKNGTRRALTEQEEWERDRARRQAEQEAEISQRERERQIKEATRVEAVHRRLEQISIEHEARKIHIAEITRAHPFELPGEGWTAEEFLAEDDTPPQPVVEELHYEGSNTLLVATHKTGKTTMEVALAKALVDGEKFLGKYKTDFPFGRVAFLNYEMDGRQFRQWVRDAKIDRLDRIIPLNLRGWKLPFWEEETMNELAQWLLDNAVRFIILDPAARAWRGLVEQEGDNIQLAEFFGALDELKRLALVPNLLISAHKPRAAEDRARGGGEIEAWPDGNWYLGKDKDGLRSLRAEGRDVLLEEIAIEFSEEDRSLKAVGSRDSIKVEQDVLALVGSLKTAGEVRGKRALYELMKGISKDRTDRALREAEDRGLIDRIAEGKIYVYSAADRD